MAQHPFLPQPLRRIVRSNVVLRHAAFLLEACFFGLLWGIAWLLPTERATRLGQALGRRLGPRSPKAEIVPRSLRIALPEASPEELQRLVPEVWAGWGAMMTELPQLERIVKGGRVDIVEKGHVRAIHEPGRPAVFVTAHLANWQLSTAAVTMLGRPLTVVFTPDSNPYVDRMIRRFRGGLGCRLVEQEGSARVLLRELREGRSIGVVVDVRRDDGEDVPFFGLPAPTSLAPARLALSRGCELVPGRVERLADSRFRVTFYDPVEPDDPQASAREQAHQMMGKLNRLFESWIRERPEEWMCTARRWRKQTLNAIEPGREGPDGGGALHAGDPSGIDDLPAR